MPRRKNTANRTCLLLAIPMIIISCLIFPSCELYLSEASPEVSKLEQEQTIDPYNIDYGINVKLLVVNKGKAGLVSIDLTLSCSNGHWTRRQTLNLHEREKKLIVFWFPEPTISTKNCLCNPTVYP